MSTPPNFNGLARAYRWMEWLSFGPCLWRCRCAFLDNMTSSRAALVLGDGDGRFTARLLEENQTILIDAVDASPSMLARLIQNAGRNSARVRIHPADARSWEPTDADFDLIVSHFFLDCLTTDEVAALATKLRPCVTDHAQWVVSEFAIPDRGFVRLAALLVVASLYLAFGLLTGLKVRRLPSHRDALKQAGFFLASEHQWLGGLLVSELWTANQGPNAPDLLPQA